MLTTGLGLALSPGKEGPKPMFQYLSTKFELFFTLAAIILMASMPWLLLG